VEPHHPTIQWTYEILLSLDELDIIAGENDYPEIWNSCGRQTSHIFNKQLKNFCGHRKAYFAAFGAGRGI
jgi:hypothetical protein